MRFRLFREEAESVMDADTQADGDAIRRFVGQYRFLSNFYLAECEMGGVVFASVENAYQAAKSSSIAYRNMLVNASPAQARRAGRTVPLVMNWDQIKSSIMLMLLRDKFSNKEMAKRLLATGTAKLEEGNTWGDTYWGTVNGFGKNQLGLLLMIVRSELRFKYGPPE